MNTANLASSEPPRLSQEEADALLESVRPQIEKLEFDAENRALLQQMIEGMGDTRGTVRLSFAESLGRVGKPATPLLVHALQNHTNPVVRRAAAKTITLISDPAAIPALVRALLTDEDTVVQYSSVGALANIGAPSVQPLLDILKSPDRPEAAKGLAAWALSFIGSEAKETVYREISSDSATVRSAVVGAASKIAQEISDARSIEILLEALNDSESDVRCEAASALANVGHEPAIPPCVALLEHEDGETRKAGALALMKLGDREVLPPLQAALERETDENVKKAIALAISLLEKRHPAS